MADEMGAPDAPETIQAADTGAAARESAPLEADGAGTPVASPPLQAPSAVNPSFTPPAPATSPFASQPAAPAPPAAAGPGGIPPLSPLPAPTTGATSPSSVNFYNPPAQRQTATGGIAYESGSEIQRLADAVSAEVHKAVIGQDEAVELAIAALFADGHVLLEGVPGTAKTLIVRALAASISSEFKRIQFTPDLMPSDITGTRIFDQKAMEFVFKEGPLFTSLLLADEINRTPPKTQAALLEAMQEHRVTIDGEPYELPQVFMVFATQNPIEFEGTYPLPEAQLDRFLLKIQIGYPPADAEQTLLRRYHQGFDANDLSTAGIRPVADMAAIARCRQLIGKVRVEDAMFGYIASIVNSTRDHRHLVLGAGPRATIALLQVGKALAAMRGRDYLIPDDVKSIAPAVLRHRLLLRPESEIEGILADSVIEGILSGLEVPR